MATTVTFSPLFSAIIAFAKAFNAASFSGHTREEIKAGYTCVKDAWRAIYELDRECAQALRPDLESLLACAKEAIEAIEADCQHEEEADAPDDSEEEWERYRQQLAQDAEYWLEDALEKEEGIQLVEGVEDSLVADSKYNAISRNIKLAIETRNQRSAERLVKILHVCFPTNAKSLTSICQMVFEQNATLRMVAPGFIEVLE